MRYSNKISRSGCFIMDLSQLGWKSVFDLVRGSFVLGVVIVLSACASTADLLEQNDVITPSVESVVTEAEPEVIPPLPLTSELVYYILTAEMAGQRGEVGLAAELYNKAANTIESPALAGRSTQIANYTRDKGRINRALERWLEVDPTDADVYIMQAPFLMIQNDWDGVVKSVDTALDLAPEKSPQFLAQIADNLSEFTKPEQALSVMEKFKLYQQHDVEALFVYGRLAEFFKQYDKALVAVEAILAEQAEREDALILKAQVLQRLGKGNKAMALLKSRAAKDEASDDLLFSYAKLLGENNKSEQALTIFERLLTNKPDNEEILFALGLLALEDKDGKQAKYYFNKLVTLGDSGKQASYFMGLSEELNDNADAALIWFASVPVESSRFEAAQSRYINLLADKGQMDKARLHLKLLRTEHPSRTVQYYLYEAAFLRERDQSQAAFDVYTEALEGFPNNIELLYGRAMTAESLHRLSVLEDDLRQILKHDPDNHTVLNALGYTLTDRTDRHQEALEMIEKALSFKPEDPFYLDSLGWVYYRLGNLDAAVRYLKQAVAIQNDAEFLAHLGEVLWQQDRHAEAKKAWQQGLEQDKDNELLSETMRRFGE